LLKATRRSEPVGSDYGARSPSAASTFEDAQRGARRESVEVGIRMEQRGPGTDARGRDQAVERLADSDTAAACRSLQVGREREVLERVQPQDRKRPQVLFNGLRLIVDAQNPEGSR
jgi:hypothetical protein